LAKAIARKANAKLSQDLFDESIELYKDAMLEDSDYTIKDGLKRAEKIKKDKEAIAYINPEIAEELREEGNKLFQEGNFPGAV
jgi:stress-induced-phosphoprotein 1